MQKQTVRDRHKEKVTEKRSREKRRRRRGGERE